MVAIALPRSRLSRACRLGRAFAVALATGLCAAPAARAAEAAADTPAASAATSPVGIQAYRVVVAAPDALKAILVRDVGVLRWQGYADMTDDLRDRLMVEAADETRNAAAAEGFFSAKITVTLDREAKPPVVTLAVDPGEPTTIAAVAITVAGPAASDVPLGTDAVAKLKADWGLPVGAVFRQARWSAAKLDALATLAAAPYPAAKIAGSEAAIDPERRSGDLSIGIDSGPAFRFGDIEVSGLAKYPASLVKNFSTLAAGTPYSQSELDRYVRRLNASGYFASVQAAVDPDTTHPDAAPVNVAVIEGPTRHFDGGLGYSTDVQFGANARYRDVNVDRSGTQMHVEARLESKAQTGSLRFVLPPNGAHWIGMATGGVARTDIEGLVTRTTFAGTRWQTVEERDTLALAVTLYLDDQQPSGAESSASHALYAEAERFWRRVDDLLAPTKGWMASLQAGAGIPGVSSRGFGRLVGRSSTWIPVTHDVELQLRAEAGGVLAPTRDGIPSPLLFRTGGDTTVRGYAFDSLGVRVADAVVPGRYYALASADITKWMSQWWGLAAFVDAGNATDSLSGFRAALGYGVGARVRTPVGPFRLDLAYGQDEHKVRAHISMGLTF